MRQYHAVLAKCPNIKWEDADCQLCLPSQGYYLIKRYEGCTSLEKIHEQDKALLNKHFTRPEQAWGRVFGADGMIVPELHVNYPTLGLPYIRIWERFQIFKTSKVQNVEGRDLYFDQMFAWMKKTAVEKSISDRVAETSIDTTGGSQWTGLLSIPETATAEGSSKMAPGSPTETPPDKLGNDPDWEFIRRDTGRVSTATSMDSWTEVLAHRLKGKEAQ
jgi:hypothetical protein